MLVARKLLRDLRRLRGTAGGLQESMEVRLLKKARRHKNFPAEVVFVGQQVMLPTLQEAVEVRRRSLRARARKKRLLGGSRLRRLAETSTCP